MRFLTLRRCVYQNSPTTHLWTLCGIPSKIPFDMGNPATPVRFPIIPRFFSGIQPRSGVQSCNIRLSRSLLNLRQVTHIELHDASVERTWLDNGTFTIALFEVTVFRSGIKTNYCPARIESPAGRHRRQRRAGSGVVRRLLGGKSAARVDPEFPKTSEFKPRQIIIGVEVAWLSG